MTELDLRGIACPRNWAHARVRLDGMRRHEMLVLIVDDPRATVDIPRAAEASGHHVLDVAADGPAWRITIEV